MKKINYYLNPFLLIIFFIITPTFTIRASPNTDIVKIKKRIIVDLMDLSVDDSMIEKLTLTIKNDGTWPDINYADVSRTGFEHRYHLRNLISLSRAFKSKNSKFHKNKKVKSVIELAVKNWVNNDYICDNWWYNQINTPRQLVTIMLLIGDELPEGLVAKAQPIIGRANINAPGARPGGDRIKIASIEAKNSLFLGDSRHFGDLIKVIENEIKFTEWVGAKYGYNYRYIPRGFSNREAGGRGIQYDNSFHHRIDGVNNTLSYGLGYANAFIEWAVYTVGTKFSFSNEKLEHLINFYLDGICKTAVYGKFPDTGAKNRSISRQGTLRPYNASTAEALMITTKYRRKELQEITDIRNSGIKPTLSHATFFWHSEHFTFQRPNFFTSVRMYSTRTFNMEEPYNSEGLLNHYRGDGTNHISRTGDEYYDIAPVFDYQKIPGATIMQKPESASERDIQKLGITDFVGAVTDGKYGAVAFDFVSPHDPLIARKSWFFFDDEYVCLGAGISSRKDLPIVTTINQCLLRSEVKISHKNKNMILAKDEKKLNDIDWVFHDSIGYVFPKPATVSIKNNGAAGSWWLINKQVDSPRDKIELDVFKLWIEHGNRPSEATYEYIVVPATSIDKLKQNISKENIRIIVNTPEIQAVKHNGLNILEAVFYKAGEILIREDVKFYCNSPGIVMLKFNEENISEISVSDPNRKLGKIHLSISLKINKKGENYSIIWNKETGMSDISIVLPKGVYAGDSVTIKL